MSPEEAAQKLKRLFQSPEGISTSDLKEIAHRYNVKIIVKNLGDLPGAYYYLERKKFIFLNNDLTSIERRFVLAHELGHAILHRTVNCFFLKKHTRLKTTIYEIEADQFAAEILLPEKIPFEYTEYNYDQLAMMYEVPVDLIKLKFNI